MSSKWHHVTFPNNVLCRFWCLMNSSCQKLRFMHKRKRNKCWFHCNITLYITLWAPNIGIFSCSKYHFGLHTVKYVLLKTSAIIYKLQEAQFERLTRELEEEREKVAHRVQQVRYCCHVCSTVLWLNLRFKRMVISIFRFFNRSTIVKEPLTR